MDLLSSNFDYFLQIRLTFKDYSSEIVCNLCIPDVFQLTFSSNYQGLRRNYFCQFIKYA